MKNNCIITRKIQLRVIGDKEEINRVYDYLRNGIKSQNKAMNQYMSALYATYMMEITKEDRKELNRLFSRVSTSKKGSGYSKDIELPKGLPSGGSIYQKVSKDFKNALKNGLQYGQISLPTYRNTNPLIIHKDYVRLRKSNSHTDMGIYHNYGNDDEFYKHLYDNDLEVYIKFANHIMFQIVFGNPHKSAELRSVFKNIFEEIYDIQGSSIEIIGTKIILNLSISIPQKGIELDDNITVGVDLGINIPAMCAINTNDYARVSLGTREEFIGHRTKIQSQRRRIQSSLKSSSGGHGRNKKLQALNKFKNAEKNWVQNYNHYISKKIIDFAIKNKAKHINLEQLKGFGESGNKFLIRNWSYYQLQEFIIYKANKYGIDVRFVNPAYTSQVCSCCGHYEEEQRISQSDFVCKNPKCKNFGKHINADFNAARNIANSPLIIKRDTSITNEKIQEAKKFYKIEK